MTGYLIDIMPFAHACMQDPQMAAIFYHPTGQDWLTWRTSHHLLALILVRLINNMDASTDIQTLWIITHLTVFSVSDPWSAESSGSFVTLQIIPGQSSLDWGEPLESGPDSEEFIQPQLPTPTEKKVCFSSLNRRFKMQKRHHWIRLVNFFRWSQRLSNPSGSRGTTCWGLVMRREPWHQVDRWDQRRRPQKRQMKGQICPVQNHKVGDLIYNIMKYTCCPTASWSTTCVVRYMHSNHVSKCVLSWQLASAVIMCY